MHTTKEIEEIREIQAAFGNDKIDKDSFVEKVPKDSITPILLRILVYSFLEKKENYALNYEKMEAILDKFGFEATSKLNGDILTEIIKDPNIDIGIPLFKLFLSKGANQGAPNELGWTALAEATYHDRQDFVELLDNKVAYLNAQDTHGQTLLHIAVNNDDGTMVKRFLNQGVDPNIKDRKGSTALHDFLDRQCDEYYSRLAPYNSLDDDTYDKLVQNLLFETKEIIDLFLKKGYQLGQKNRHDYTELEKAAFFYNPDIIALFLARGVELSALDKNGIIFLNTVVLAVSFGSRRYVKLVEFLLDKGANPNAPDNDGKTALHIAAAEGCPQKFVEFLLEKGANPNARDNDGKTALHIAVINNHFEIVASLLEKGAALNICDNDGKTALHRAVIKNHFKIVASLLEKGAEPNICDTDGKTACEYDHYDGRHYDSYKGIYVNNNPYKGHELSKTNIINMLKNTSHIDLLAQKFDRDGRLLNGFDNPKFVKNAMEKAVNACGSSVLSNKKLKDLQMLKDLYEAADSLPSYQEKILKAFIACAAQHRIWSYTTSDTTSFSIFKKCFEEQPLPTVANAELLTKGKKGV